MAYKNDSYLHVNSPKLLNLQVSKHHCGQGSIFPAKFQECVITVTVLDIVIRSGELTVWRWRTVNTMISPPEGEKVSLTAVVPGPLSWSSPTISSFPNLDEGGSPHQEAFREDVKFPVKFHTCHKETLMYNKFRLLVHKLLCWTLHSCAQDLKRHNSSYSFTKAF